MVKNLNTIERSERIRLGKYTPDEQTINSIIINASSQLIDANTNGFHVAPVRKDSSITANTLVYNVVTKEIVDSGDNINKTLEDVTAVGNTTPYTTEFQNTNASLITHGPVGIGNTSPVHTLDVGSNLYVDDTGSNVMDVTGNVFISDTLLVVGNLEVLGDTTLVTQQNLLIDDSIVELGKNNYESDTAFDLGFVMTRSTAVSNVGIGYREAQDEFFIGYTDSNAYQHYITPNADNNVKFHVYGSIVTDSNVGIANTSPVHTLDVGSNLYVDDTASNILVVHGDTKIDETLFANNISISNDINASGNLNALTELNVTGNVYASSNVDVSKELNVSGNVYASSNVDITKDLNVTGNVYAESEINVTGNTNALSELNITGNVYALSNVDITKDLNVTGNVYAGSEVNVTGNVYASSNVDITKDLNVTGNVYASSNVDVTKNLTVSEDISTSSNLQVTKDATITGHIFANSNVIVANDIAVTRDVYARDVKVNRDLTTTGNVYASSNVDITKDLNVTGNVYADSNVSVANDLDISGNVYASSNVNVTGDVNVTGETRATSNLTVSKNATIQGELNANGNVIVDQDLTVIQNMIAQSDINITKDLTVTGNVFANSNISVAKNLDVSGETYFTGNATVSKKLSVTNDIQASRDVNITRDANITRNVDVSGNVTASYYYGNGNTLSNVNLEQVTSYGNSTSNTVFFNNSDTALVTIGDMGVGTDTPDHKLHVAGDIRADTNIYAVQYFGGGNTLSNVTLQVITDKGNTTSNTIQFTNADVGLVATGNVEAARFIGDGSYLTGLVTTLEDVANNGNVSSNTIQLTNSNVGLVATGNIEASYFKGDGTTLTGVALEVDLASNASRVSVLETDLTSNASRVGVLETDLASNAGRVGVLETDLASNAIRVGVLETDLASNAGRVGVLETDLASNAIRVDVLETDLASNASRVGVLETDLASNASRIDVVEQQGLSAIVNIGNVSSNTIQLTNADVGLKASGNVEAARFIGDGSHLTGLVTTLQDVADNGNVSSNTIQLTNSNVGLVATGNIEAGYFKGDGSELTGISTVSNLEGIVLNGNVTSQTIHIQNTVSLTTTGNVGIANTNPMCDLAVGSNLCVNDISSNVLTVDGNILAHQITLDSIQIASVYALEYVTMTGNTTSNTVEFTNSATGLVTTANVGVANSNPIHTLDVGSNLWVDDTGSNVLYMTGNVHAAGSQLTVGEKLGIGNTTPGHDLSVGSNLYVEDTGSNVLVIDGNASINSTLFLGAVEISPAYTLEEVTGQGNVTSNVIQFTDSDVGIVTTGGIVTNSGSYASKQYAYSNVNIPTGFSNVSLTFASNVFYAKVTAQLLHGNEEVSTLVFDTQGGTRDGTTSSLDIATGSKSLFGSTNAKPWNSVVATTPTMVILEPSGIGTQTYGVDVFIDYMSSAPDGKLNSINVDGISVKSFVY